MKHRGPVSTVTAGCRAPPLVALAGALALGVALPSLAADAAFVAGSADTRSAQQQVQPQRDAAEPLRVTGLRLGRTPGRTRLVFDLSAEPDHPRQQLPRVGEVRLKLPAGRWQAVAPASLFAGSPVLALEHAELPDEGLQVVLRLRSEYRVEIFPLRPHGGQGHRLVVDLHAPDVLQADRQEQGGTLRAAAGVPIQRATGSGLAVPADAGALQGPSSATAPAPALGATTVNNTPWASDLRLSGYGELSSAYTVAGPSRWSQLRARVEAGVTGRLGTDLRFKLAGRAQGDAAFSLEDDVYPDAVRDDQRSEFTVREAWLDAGAGDWQFRLGRQHVVWGEMVGLFLADVVSARDMREFYLQEFDAMRIPQWAVRAERFAGSSHFELLWIPHPSYDEIGKPGADFYPFPVPAGVPVRHDRPSRNLDNSHWGGRVSHLVGGWDLSAFYYQGQDVAPTLYATEQGLVLRNERLKQAGATFSKDFHTWVLRGEAVHTTGRPWYADGAVAFQPEHSESLDYVVGVSIPRGDWRWDVQLYGRELFQHRRAMFSDASEAGFTFLVNYGFGQRLEWELLYLSGFNRSDWSLQPRLVYNITPEWRLQLGADLFGGDAIGLFGQFDDSDRVQVELRRWF